MPQITDPTPASTAAPAPRRDVTQALESGADQARPAPSVHDHQPWRVVPAGGRLEFHADRDRPLRTPDPAGRALAQDVGAALLDARAALASSGWAATVELLPSTEHPDLLAVLTPVAGAPDPGLAALAAVSVRRTDRRPSDGTQVPEQLLRRLIDAVTAEGASLIPVRTEEHRRLVARLGRQADAHRTAVAASRADGAPEDVDPAGPGALPPGTPPPGTRSGAAQTMVLLATPLDDAAAWLSAGQALERLLLELALDGWAADPLTPVVEVPLTRTQLRAALAWNGHPQVLLRIGRAARTPARPHRRGRPPA